MSVAHVERVDPAVTRPLRQRVLRPLGTLGADPADAVAYAARSEQGQVVGCAVVRAEPPVVPLPGADGPAWRLRGMAVDPELQGRGVGRPVLDAVVAHVAAAGGGLLWCNARTPAQSFYARAGFAAVGEVWDEGDIGPHVVMWRTVAPG